jgi:hypothetical protein
MSSYADKLAEFHQRLTDIGAQLAGLADRRKQHSLAAASGDKTAAGQITALDAEAASLHKEEQTLASAIETAQALERRAQQEAEARERREREVEAHRIAQAVIALNCELDQAMLALRQLWERRQALLAELGNSNVADLGFVMRLSHKSGANAAAAYAGLTKYFAMEMTPNSAVRPLSTANEILLRVGQLPTPTRARLQS